MNILHSLRKFLLVNFGIPYTSFEVEQFKKNCRIEFIENETKVICGTRYVTVKTFTKLSNEIFRREKK